MEARLRRFLLNCFASSLLVCTNTAYAAEETLDQIIDPVIQPEIERMDFNESRINPDNIEINASFGLMSVEDFGTSLLVSAQATYRISEGFFVGAELGQATVGESRFEDFLPGINLLSDDERVLSYYLFNIGYDIFPGETFLTENTTYNNAFYLIAGIGNTQFAGQDNYTISFGFGYRVLLSNNFSASFGVRDHTFNADFLGPDKLTHNLQFTASVGIYF